MLINQQYIWNEVSLNRNTLDKCTYWAADKQEPDLVISLGSSGSVFNLTFEVILWNPTTAYRRINSICNGGTFPVLYGWWGFCKKTKLPEWNPPSSETDLNNINFNKTSNEMKTKYTDFGENTLGCIQSNIRFFTKFFNLTLSPNYLNCEAYLSTWAWK